MSDRSLRHDHDALSMALVPAALLAFACAVSACGAAQPKQSGEENNFDSTPSGAAASDTPKASDKSAPKDKDESLSDDQKAQMEVALRRGGEKSSNCATVVPDAAKGEGEVKVTFDGKKGRATDVSVGAPWAGTPAEACIKRAFIGEIIVPFEGVLEVPYTVKIGGKPADAKAKPAKDKK